jgi:hypothetical protein
MNLLALGTFHDRSKLGPLLKSETEQVHALRDQGFVLAGYRRVDSTGAVLILKVDTLQQAKELLAQLPFAKAGLLTFEFVEIAPV